VLLFAVMAPVTALVKPVQALQSAAHELSAVQKLFVLLAVKQVAAV
jgi:hypothetical protein